jgi:glycosyltransferase involved in cell wall biosynthesis
VRGSRRAERLSELTKVSKPSDPYDLIRVMPAKGDRLVVARAKSLQEGFGLTVTEAMIKARPPVASRVGGIQDQVRHEREGLLVDDPADLGAFAAVLNRLLGDNTFATHLGERARVRAVEEFVGDRHLARYADLLRGVVASEDASA